MRNLILAALPLVTLPALADVALEYSDDSIVMVSKDKVRLGDDESYMLLEKGKDTFLMVDNTAKTYMEVTENFMSDLTATMSSQIEEMLAELPPEQREMYRESMESMMPSADNADRPEMKVKKTGNKDKVAGFSCTEMAVSYESAETQAGAEMNQIMCIATADELEISKTEVETITAAMQALSSMAGYEDDGSSPMDLEALGGIPIRTGSEDLGIDSELVSVNKEKIDPAAFEVPAGYRKVTLEESMMGE